MVAKIRDSLILSLMVMIALLIVLGGQAILHLNQLSLRTDIQEVQDDTSALVDVFQSNDFLLEEEYTQSNK